MASINDKLRKYKSLFSTTLSTGIGTGTSDTITPATVTGLPTDTAITLTIDRVDSSGTATPSKLERIKGIISGGNLIDYVRGVDGTTEQAHSAGAVVEMVWNAADLNDIVDWGLVEHSQLGTHTNITAQSINLSGTVTDSNVTNSSMARQAIINGNFDVWQRGTSITLSSDGAQYTADRFTAYAHHADYSFSRQDGTGVPGSQYCARIQRANGSTQVAPFNCYYCGLEKTDSVKFRGKKLTLSFWAKKGANFSPTTFTAAIYTGTTGDENVWNMTGAAIVGSVSPTLTTDWQKFTVTTTNVIAANVNEITVRFVSSACVGTAGAADYVDVTQVQLCAGDVALPFMPKSKTVEEDDCVRYYRIGQLLGIANTTSILAIANDFATKPLRTAITTSNFKIYTTKANAIAEVAQQALTTPGVGDTNITQSSYIVNEVNGVIGLQLSGTPLTAGRAYSGYYVINQEL